MYISIKRRRDFASAELESMHKFRAEVFKDRKAWDVPLIGNMEIDGYDALDPFYMLIQDGSNGERVLGCWRILPTTGPYMLKNTFPELLHGHPAPESNRVWELSRFAIKPCRTASMRFSDVTERAIEALAHFSSAHDVESYVTVTTVGVERMLIRAGLPLSRFGPALQIGIERAVALRIQPHQPTQHGRPAVAQRTGKCD